MYCTKCGKQVDNKEKHCLYCGNKLEDPFQKQTIPENDHNHYQSTYSQRQNNNISLSSKTKNNDWVVGLLLVEFIVFLTIIFVLIF
ncbi:MAG: hypothetical protein LBM99_02995 [Bacillales bacterium]|jgi:uncharacterized membrane protein YvbJ|nr:hypothetical protein [Bacillales bacterium]